MELQLGLALSSNPTKGFDLNYYCYEPNKKGSGLGPMVQWHMFWNNHTLKTPKNLSLIGHD